MQNKESTWHQPKYISESVWDLGSKHTDVQRWNMDANREAEQKTESIRNELPRRIIGVARLDHVRSKNIWNSLKIRRDIIEKVELRSMGYFGHVPKMDQNHLPYISMRGRVNGTRVRGRPRFPWIDKIKKNSEERGLTVVEAERAALEKHTCGWRRESVQRHRQGAKRKRNVYQWINLFNFLGTINHFHFTLLFVSFSSRYRIFC